MPGATRGSESPEGAEYCMNGLINGPRGGRLFCVPKIDSPSLCLIIEANIEVFGTLRRYELVLAG